MIQAGTNRMEPRENKPKLSIFKTFKTKREELTGEAIRQRSIIMNLATETRPTMNTRTSISHKIAENNNTVWQNIYSGIFRDFDEVLLPLGIAEEAGRLPLNRGPKALQEHGMPHYKLTQGGMLVAASLDELKDERIKIMTKFLDDYDLDKEFKETILILLNIAPNFVFTLIKQYVELFAMEGVELEFRDTALRAIAKKAINRKGGARGLRSILENILLSTMYELPSLPGLAKVVLDENVVLEKSEPILIYDNNSQQKTADGSS